MIDGYTIQEECIGCVRYTDSVNDVSYIIYVADSLLTNNLYYSNFSPTHCYYDNYCMTSMCLKCSVNFPIVATSKVDLPNCIHHISMVYSIILHFLVHS